MIDGREMFGSSALRNGDGAQQLDEKRRDYEGEGRRRSEEQLSTS